MERVHLYSQMLEFKKQILTPEELCNIDLWSVRRKFDTQEDMDAYLAEKTLKVEEGYYRSGLRIVHGLQGYASVFYYDKSEMTEHFEKTGGASGFTGKCYSDWIYFDLESQINPEDLISKVSRFLDYLRDKQIIHRICFSGSKGIHLYIPMKYVSYSNELEGMANRICKAFAKQITNQFPELSDIIDPQVYSINTILRLPFSINPKSGFLKSLRRWESGKLIKVENDIELFRMSLRTFICPELQDIDSHWKLDESLLNQAMPMEIKFDTYFPCPYGEKACIWKMFNTKLKSGDHRHDYAMRLMSFFKNDKELPNSWVWALLQRWNEDCLEDPMTEKELQNTFKGIDTYNYNLCKDPMMNKFCTQNNQCQFWSNKNSVQKGVTILDALRAAKEDALDTSPKYNLNTIFEEMDVTVRPNRGQIVGIVAGSKVGLVA